MTLDVYRGRKTTQQQQQQEAKPLLFQFYLPSQWGQLLKEGILSLSKFFPLKS